jgi:hypothetical protein
MISPMAPWLGHWNELQLPTINPHSSLQGLAIPSKVYLEQLLNHWKPVYLGQLRASDRTPSRKLVKVEAIPQQQLHEAV